MVTQLAKKFPSISRIISSSQFYRWSFIWLRSQLEEHSSHVYTFTVISIDLDINIIPLPMLFSKTLMHLSSPTFVLRDPPIHSATYFSLIILVKEYKLELYTSVYEWRTWELIIYKSQLFRDDDDKAECLSGWNYIKNSVIMCTSHLIWLSWLYRSVGPTDTKLNQQSNIIVGHGSQHRTRAEICPSGYDVTSFSLCTCRGQSHDINVETFRLGQNTLSVKKRGLKT
jgi:hypothetical protein